MDDIRASIALSRAHDWASFRNALRDWAVAIFNFVYADANGHIGYQMAGRVPLRGRVMPGFRDANTGADQWHGYIAFDDLPNMYDPPSGYVASANQRIVPDNWRQPIYGAYSQGHRGVRLAQALGGRNALDVATNISLQNDVKNCRAERLCPHIVRHLDRVEAASFLRRTLNDWDYRHTSTSIAPTLFEAFTALWQREVISHHMPERLLDLTHQQTGLAAALLEDASIAYFADGTEKHVCAVAANTLDTLQAKLGVIRLRGNGAACIRHTGLIRSATRPSTSARAKWMAARILCAIPAASCRHTLPAQVPSTGSWSILPRPTASSPCRI